MKVVVFGGTGPTGRLIIQEAIDAGMHVRVVARTPEKVTERPDGLEVMQGDALDASDVARAIEGQDAVVSALGVPYTFKPITIYSVAAGHILAAMMEHGVRRFVAVSSGGTHPGRDPNTPFFFEWILKPIFGRTLYADMRRMEALLEDSDVDWTVLRPAQLVDTPGGNARVEPDAYTIPGATTTSRADLAGVIVEQLQAPTLVRRGAAVAE